jgi:transposase-like protein
MAISKEIKYAKLDQLLLDPKNPRLGRQNVGDDVSQAKVLDLMKDWTLDELAVSFLESGFWPQEAVLVVEEPLYGKPSLVVVEGNRRIAALMLLRQAGLGTFVSKKWEEIAKSSNAPKELFESIPYLKVDSRKDVEAFLGFRHVTGIKEWKPAEKAEYIAKLIEEGMSYEAVTRKIGSKAPTVRQNYIAYRLLLQMEHEKDIDVERVEEKFSVLYLSLRTQGVQQYLHIEIQADPKAALKPVPNSHLKNLAYFARWLFGTEQSPPIVKESRQVDQFGEMLESKEAVEYLERADVPSFEMAYRIAGGDEPEIVKLVGRAADNIEASLSRAHAHVKSERLQKAVRRLGVDAIQLLSLFPEIKDDLLRVGA